MGTRLRPLTETLPKPLVPLYGKPLVEWAMEACEAAGVEEMAMNTHPLAERWVLEGEREGVAGENGVASRVGKFQGREVHLFHEPVLLETGGAIRNVRSWVGEDGVLVHNGDIYASLDVGKLIRAHEASGLPVTLALRSEGEARHVAYADGRVRDIRRMNGVAEGTHVFTGIYCFEAEFLERIPARERVSVIPAFLQLAAEGRLGAVVLDEGEWRDLGTVESYLAAHRELRLGEAVAADAVVEEGARVEGSVLGSGAVVEAGAVVERCVVWPGVRVARGRVCRDEVVVGVES